MALGEALARAPSLRLLRADPARTAEVWEGVLRGLEGIGAAVESERPGEAFFAAGGLRGLYGGEVDGVMAKARAAAKAPVRLAAAPTRFAAFAAAGRGARLPRGVAGSRAEAIVPAGALPAFLATLPVATLAPRLQAGAREAEELVASLRRLGIRTLGALASMSADRVADRFGRLGLRALRLARGEDTPLRPRALGESVTAEVALPDGAAGPQLDRALELLVDRLLSAPERRGRTVLALRLDALLSGGGSWSVEQVLGRASASAEALCLLLGPRLAELPEPAESLHLHATGLGPPVADQMLLAEGGRASFRSRLGESVRELREVQGAEALLKVIDVDSGSRIPERRLFLTPHPDL